VHHASVGAQPHHHQPYTATRTWQSCELATVAVEAAAVAVHLGLLCAWVWTCGLVRAYAIVDRAHVHVYIASANG